MRILFTILLLNLGWLDNSSFKAQTINWTADKKISTGGSGSNIKPRLVALDSEHGIILWGNDVGKSIHYALWENDSLSGIRNINMNQSKAFITNWASTEIAGRNQYVYIVYKEEPAESGKIFLLRSTDYGKTFSSQIIAVDPVGFLSRFPGVAIDKDNQPIISYMRFNTDWTQAHYVSIRSSDFGNTFSNFTEVTDLAKGTACDCCPVGMISDEDRIAVLYRNNRNNIRNMTASVSFNNGISYDMTVELDTANWFLQSCPATGGDGFFNNDLLHTSWISGRTGINKVYYSSLNLTTQKIDAFQIMTHNQGRNLQQLDPSIAGNKDTVGIVWSELSNGLDIFFSYFTNNNTADLVKNTSRINIDRVSNQATPDLAFRNGNFYVCWQDVNDNTVRFKKGFLMTITSQKEAEANAPVKLFNTPAGIEILSETELDQWNLFDITGRELAHGQKINSAKVPLNSNGIYFIRYLQKGRLNTMKFQF